MVRQPATETGAWPFLHLEGNLLTPAMVARISDPGDDSATRASYSVRKGLTIREDIATAFRVGQSHWDEFARRHYPSLAATQRFVRDFLAETFGFHDLAPTDGVVSFVAGERVPVVVAPPGEDLERRSPTLSTDRSRSPAFALQDWLNHHDHALWGLVTNGRRMRLLRDNASLTRPAHIEADLEGMFANEDAASFAAFWLLIHRTRFGQSGAPATDCPLEHWREEGARLGEAARERLAAQVRQALKVLGSGVLSANRDLASQLQTGHVPLTDWFNELLRLVYRLIFLMVAEDRNLLHPARSTAAARQLYRDGYSLTTLRRQCQRRASWDRHHDRYEGMKVVFRALAEGEERLALPALGGLFAPRQLPRLETVRLPNNAFMAALWHLAWLPERTGRAPVNWRAMETEELGSVYESLLELQPQLADDGRSLVFAAEASERKGNQRKTTGSYYTPDSLVQALLDSALDPVLDSTEAAAADPAAALLKLSILDPACGSGHFLLAAARRLATRLARIRADGAPGLADFRPALRDVARCCLHGVDKNPMAVELARVALWIETVTPGLPLGFLDGQIRCGDALLGLVDLSVLENGIPDAAYKPLTGDHKATAKRCKKLNQEVRDRGQGSLALDTLDQEGLMPAVKPLALKFARLRALGEDTVGQIKAKASRFRDLRQTPDFRRARAAADLYVAAFLLPKTDAAGVPTTNELWQTLRDQEPPLGPARQAAAAARAFHWPLEFPDVMEQGGFDVVLGNPPWERIKLQEQEFFASRSDEIADAPNKAARNRLLKALATEPVGSARRGLWDAFLQAKRLSEAVSEFAHVPGGDGGRFPFTGRGDVNTYALFAELVANLSSARAGVIVPTGVATDATTAPFFAHLVSTNRLASLVDFENRAGIFPSVHRSFKFCLLTMGQREPAARFAFFLTDPAQLAVSERSFTLSPRQIAAINPNTRTAPVFRSRQDGELTAKIYGKVPVLMEESRGAQGNPWGVCFARLFDMSNDSHLFRTAAALSAGGWIRNGTGWVAEGANSNVAPDLPTADGPSLDPAPEPSRAHRYVPLYEAKMIHQFDHRWATYGETGKTMDATPAQKANPHWEPTPRYWVPAEEVTARLDAKGWNRSWLLGWRRICRATDERTVIAEIIPQFGVGDSLFLMLPSTDHLSSIPGLLGALTSLVCDFVARQKVGGTNLSFFIIKQFPILPPSFYSPERLAFVTPRVLALTYTSHTLAPFARDLGYGGPPFSWDEQRRALLRAELDAFYARAYGLSRDDLRYILDPADVMGADYPSETFRGLKEKEIKAHGEYRTRRLVLAAWDELEAGGGFVDLELCCPQAPPNTHGAATATAALQRPPPPTGSAL
ncbi:MAG: N-6 DNA methylase [Cyanobacteria bacterium MAG CAR1_bin_15]|nr:N-6 DNA methylase [Cyanobacteria bacterium MAG CAR1_bin_15]